VGDLMDVYVFLKALDLYPPKDKPPLRTRELEQVIGGDGAVYLDYDERGNVVGIEILGAAGLTADGVQVGSPPPLHGGDD
jgi:uncharacterized protein YuzE